MINFRIYNGTHSQIMADMNTSGLQVGQKLVRLIDGEYESTPSRKVHYTIVKILKTRLVLAEANGTELRVVVDNNWRAGEVTDKREGGGDSYRRPVIKLATEDQEHLVDAQIAIKAERLQKEATRNQALQAARSVVSTRFATLEDVEAAVEALQALAAQMRAEAV